MSHLVRADLLRNPNRHIPHLHLTSLWPVLDTVGYPELRRRQKGSTRVRCEGGVGMSQPGTLAAALAFMPDWLRIADRSPWTLGSPIVRRALAIAPLRVRSPNEGGTGHPPGPCMVVRSPKSRRWKSPTPCGAFRSGESTVQYSSAGSTGRLFTARTALRAAARIAVGRKGPPASPGPTPNGPTWCSPPRRWSDRQPWRPWSVQ